VVKAFFAVLILLFGIWGTLALYFQLSDYSSIQVALSSLFALFSLFSILSLFLASWSRRVVPFFGVISLSLLVWYENITPSNTREWQENVAILPYATQKQNLITMHNIRNFTYKSEEDYEAAYYDKTFDINKLIGVDLVSVYWMGPSIAHIFLSFSFAEDKHLAISIETRMEKGESYSTLAGFFRKYELHYVVADERDVIALRTNYRNNPKESLYLYETSGTKEEAKELFLVYVKRINELKENPEFYNSLLTNCTTAIWKTAHTYLEDLPFSWKIVASGYVPEYLYENGRLDTQGVSFLELQKKAYVNERAKKVLLDENFSKAIRE
jgi:hypothetical protein